MNLPTTLFNFVEAKDVSVWRRKRLNQYLRNYVVRAWETIYKSVISLRASHHYIILSWLSDKWLQTSHFSTNSQALQLDQRIRSSTLGSFLNTSSKKPSIFTTKICLLLSLLVITPSHLHLKCASQIPFKYYHR